MNYTHLLSEINQATSFDLYRLRVAINKELENPERIVTIKRKVHVGMELTYFCSTANTTLHAKILECHAKKVTVLDIATQIIYTMPYYMLNLENAHTAIHEQTTTLTANHLAIGDCVGFISKDGRNIVGTITRLNQKTASLITPMGQWRVGYSLLRRVHEAEIDRVRLSSDVMSSS